MWRYKCLTYLQDQGQDSVFDTASRYGPSRTLFGLRWGQGIFPLPNTSTPALEPIHHPQMGARALLSSSCADVRNEWSYTSTPLARMACYRETFTLFKRTHMKSIYAAEFKEWHHFVRKRWLWTICCSCSSLICHMKFWARILYLFNNSFQAKWLIFKNILPPDATSPLYCDLNVEHQVES